MPYFTPDNTEGFRPADLAVLNAAHARVMAQQDADYGGDGDDFGLSPEEMALTAKNLGDALNNAWLPGSTADDLIGRLGREWIVLPVEG